MILSLEIDNYRSLRRFSVRCGKLVVITGGNGVGKTNLYRALCLLSRWAEGTLGQAVAEEGGMSSLLWRGARDKQDQSGFRLRIHARMEPFSCELSVGLPALKESAFKLSPDIKAETVWVGSGKPVRSNTIATRKSLSVTVRDAEGRVRQETLPHAPGESTLSLLRDAQQFPALAALRSELCGWRFYHQFRTDPDSPLRKPVPGAWTTSLAGDGHDLAAVIGTVLESDRQDEFLQAIDAALPGCVPLIQTHGSMFQALLSTPGLDEPVSAPEWSDGTLRYIALATALIPVRPAGLIVLNEPESSLHPSLIPALADLIVKASKDSQVWVISHSEALTACLQQRTTVKPVHLRMEKGQTTIHGLEVAYLDEDAVAEDD